MKTILLNLILLMILLFIFCYYLSKKVTHPKIHKYEETYQWEIEHGRIVEDQFKNLQKEEVFIDSPYGYKIHGLYFPNKNSQKAVILCHGITWTLCGSLKYVQMFLKKGFSVLIYDHRNHGLTGGKDTSYGYFEKFDLKACTDWVSNQLGKDAVIGLLGESMGAGTVLQNIAIDSRIKFCIADCGYSDIVTLFKYRLGKDFKIKRLPIVEITSIITKLRIGWSFKDISPIRSISKVDTPILFTHGEADDFVPTWMSKEMYKAKKGFKDIYIAPNATHVETYWKNMQEYENRVDRFLKENGITKQSISAPKIQS
ncbi:alpha/beta hydrolase [Clostridium sp. DJ247]|nr:alpha/beta hydrolase [Clostridium sp. DJ247]